MPNLIALLAATSLAIGSATGPAAKPAPATTPTEPNAEKSSAAEGAPSEGEETKPATEDESALKAAKEAAAKEEATKAEELEAQMEKARAAVEAKRFEEAATALEAAYRLSRTRSVLLDWAHAERFAERCDRAVFLYDRYLDAIATDVAAGKEQAARKDKAAREGRAKCPEAKTSGAPVLIIPPPATSTPKPKPAKTEEPAATPSPSAAGAGAGEAELDTPSPDDRHAADIARANRDPLGWSLFGAGLFSLAGAGALFAVAHTGKPDPMGVPTHATYLDAIDRSARLETGAWIFVGLGSALVLAGMVRLAFVSSRARHRRPRHARGLQLGRF